MKAIEKINQGAPQKIRENPARVPITEAAKRHGKGRKFIRDLVDSGLLKAWRMGGTEKKPRLFVDLNELRRVIDRELVYVPKGMTKADVMRRSSPKRAVGELDPTAWDL